MKSTDKEKSLPGDNKKGKVYQVAEKRAKCTMGQKINEKSSYWVAEKKGKVHQTAEKREEPTEWQKKVKCTVNQ